MNAQANLGKLLVVAGALTIGVSLILTAVIGEPLILFAVLAGVIDVVIGMVISAGGLSRRAGEADEADENPYARED